jgi:hypothetical protein
MNNEPVAWMSPDGKVSDTEGKLFYIPLYTHPVKELTDEEIHDLMDEICQAVGDDIERAMYRMARAILRKAQEK